MQKVQPAKNNFDMDFLNGFNKQIGGTAPAAAPVQSAPVAVHEEAVTEIDPTSNIESDFDASDISIDDDIVLRLKLDDYTVVLLQNVKS